MSYICISEFNIIIHIKVKDGTKTNATLKIRPFTFLVFIFDYFPRFYANQWLRFICFFNEITKQIKYTKQSGAKKNINTKETTHGLFGVKVITVINDPNAERIITMNLVKLFVVNPIRI